MMAALQNAIFIVVPFLIIITVIVTVHELGHFLTARAFGVAIDRFSIGFGRALLAWNDRWGVEWRIGWMPLGGYVKFAGDENAASVPDKEDLEDMRANITAREGPGGERKYLHFKPLWQRALIVVAGPAANFLLAIVLFSLIFGTVGTPTTPFRIDTVVPGSAADRAGFKPGDRILAADGHRIEGFEDLVSYVAYRDGVTVGFDVERDGRPVTLIAVLGHRETPTLFGATQTTGSLGVTPRPDGSWRYVRQNPIAAIGMGASKTWEVLSTTTFYLGRILTGHVNLNQLHGIIGIAKASGAITKQAIDQAPHDLGDQVLGVVVNLVGFAALISVSIGFMNLLPLPVLDGGHLLFYAYEWVARRPVAARVQAAGYRLGLALLVCLMLFANLHDLPLVRVFHFFGSLFS
jgi:regulator of sigma E protease